MKKKILALMQKWGYTLKGGELWGLPIPGYASGAYVMHVRDEFDAADNLRWLIKNDEYSDALDGIQNQK